ncbi:apolipoprotein N-acyltransferase [Shinella sp. HZN7]|uniref:apolipoprotein N-acyltransferase n=2 Tax=Hyphomicrobiales TaxID=356 RepID=UPI0007DA8D70|nr:apolipoprotein N-acyltransferase [Shinella sp. HZN7]ANH05730.1 apolipoprotein N-acyltransferase [Shinella sp. HZN7]
MIGRLAGIGTRRAGLPMRGLVAIILGVATSTAFEPWAVWYAMPLGVCCLIWLLHNSGTWRDVMLCATAFGFGQAFPALRWIVDAFGFQAALPPAMGWLAVALLAGYLALYWSLAAMAAWFLGRSDPFRFAVAFAAAFTIAEWLRGTVLTGFPWNPIGVIWLNVPPVASNAAIVGTLGLSGLTILLSGLLMPPALRDGRARGLAGVVLMMAIAGASMSSTQPPPDTTTPIVVVQPNISQDQKWRPEEAVDHLYRHMALSGTNAEPGRMRLVFWPETAITAELDGDPRTRRLIASVLGEKDLLFVGAIGAARRPDGGVSGATNSVFVIGSQGEIRGRYDKRHLVPFGEYVPVPHLLEALGLSRFAAGSGPFISGSGSRSLEMEGLTAGVDICYEIIFAGAVADSHLRPQFLFNPSNTNGPHA